MFPNGGPTNAYHFYPSLVLGANVELRKLYRGL